MASAAPTPNLRRPAPPRSPSMAAPRPEAPDRAVVVCGFASLALAAMSAAALAFNQERTLALPLGVALGLLSAPAAAATCVLGLGRLARPRTSWHVRLVVGANLLVAVVGVGALVYGLWRVAYFGLSVL